MDSTTTEDASLSRASDQEVEDNDSTAGEDQAVAAMAAAEAEALDDALQSAFVVGEGGHAADFSHIRRELRPSPFAGADHAHCTLATSTLLLPFSFWPAEDLQAPRDLARSLLQRLVCLGGTSCVPLWETRRLPSEVEELSPHFRQLLNADGGNASPIHLALTQDALEFLFSDACLLADTHDNQIGKKRCEWRRVQLSVFPLGAVLALTVDWMSGPRFTLADWRLWMHVAKFRCIKPGTTHGWAFRSHVEPLSEAERSFAASLGPELYEAIYGGGCISLSSVANWLVRLPSEPATCKRVSAHDFCQHHSFATDEVLELWTNSKITLSIEGITAYEAQTRGGKEKSRSRDFMGIFETLTMHCLSERLTLERLAFLVAVHSQQLPPPGLDSNMTLEDKDRVRRKLMALAMQLARYRSSMASDDCGGRHEFHAFFGQLRAVFDVALLKDELREDLQDTLAVTESDWVEERRRHQQRERFWKKKRLTIEKRLEEVWKEGQWRVDAMVYLLSAVCVPFFVVASCFGMNNNDTPVDLPWGYLLLGCFVCSVALIVLIWANFYRSKPSEYELRQTLQLYQRGKGAPLAAFDEHLPDADGDNDDDHDDDDDDAGAAAAVADDSAQAVLPFVTGIQNLLDKRG